jgi:predicted HicB family RNase H-like nuclease
MRKSEIQRTSVGIRIERELLYQAKVAAAIRRVTLGAWLEEAIKEKLKKEAKKEAKK